MKYQAPFGSLDPFASYVDRNTPGAIAGSKVPAAAIEHPQRELAALIEKSGGTPSEADLVQVARAVRSQRLNYAVAAGPANALTIALDPAPASLSELVGVPIRVKITATNTGAATLSANGLTATPITRPSGVALQAGDLSLGGFVTVIFDGTVFRALFLPNFGVTGSPSLRHTRLSNGLIIQVGSIGTSASGPVTVAYPISFLTATLAVMVTDESSPVTANQMSVFGTGAYALTGFQVIATRDFATNLADSANYIALGY